MEKVSLQINGMAVSFACARKMAENLALEDNELAMLISWNDAHKGVHSPQCLKCEITGKPGWEVYGENHQGRLRISVNDEEYVFIFS